MERLVRVDKDSRSETWLVSLVVEAEDAAFGAKPGVIASSQSAGEILEKSS